MRTLTTKRMVYGMTLFSTLVATGAGCGKTTTSPGLMLAFSSDMSVPKDVTAVGLYIRSKGGTVLYNNVVQAEVSPSGQRTVRFPSTFAVLSNGNAASVRVQLVAYGPKLDGNRKALVMRDSTTGVPTDRLGLLRMPLLWINQGSVRKAGATTPTSSLSPLSSQVEGARITALADEALAGIPEDGYPGACAEGQTYIGGECRASETVPVEDFTEENNPDNPNGTCFSVEKCFAAPTELRYDDSGIVDIGGTNASDVNLALITADGAGIKLPDGRFAISLSANSPFEGYTVTNGKITLSPGVLKVLKSGAAQSLIATAACEPKSEAIGNCGEWNQKANSIVPKQNPPTPSFPDAGTSREDAGAIDAGISDASSFDGAPFDATAPDGGPQDSGPKDGGPSMDANPNVGRGVAVSSGEPHVMGLTVASGIGYFMRNGTGQGGGFDPSLVKVDANALGNSMPEANSTSPTVPQADGYHIDDITFGAYGGLNYQNRRSLFLVNTGAKLAANFDIVSGLVNKLTLPASFAPYVFLASDGIDANGGPLLMGETTGTGAAVFFTNNVTYTSAIVSGLNAGEWALTGKQKSPPNTYLVGTNQGRLLECTKTANPSTAVSCTQKGTTQGVVSDIALAGGKAYLLVTNPAAEQVFEGVYVYDGNGVTPLATRATQAGILHFEQYTPDHGNHLATNGVNYVYVTTYATGGLTSRVVALPIAGGNGVVVAEGAYAARDISVDGAFVYYVDYGDGTNANNGGVFRVPQL